MLKAFIVEDEPLARDELAYLLQRTRKIEIVGDAESLEGAIAGIGRLKPDVVFLDIQLSDDSGLELARRLGELDTRPDIVFATAYDEHALKAFELNAADYILKPYDEDRIARTVDKLAKLQENRIHQLPAAAPRASSAPGRTGKLAVTVEERILLVAVNSILYCSSEEGKTLIVTQNGTYRSPDPLVVFEQKLLGTPIVRVHRAFLANVDQIAEIQPWFHSTCTLIMNDGSKVPVSRTFLKELKQLLGL